jgi:hypothetical protein
MEPSPAAPDADEARRAGRKALIRQLGRLEGLMERRPAIRHAAEAHEIVLGELAVFDRGWPLDRAEAVAELTGGPTRRHDHPSRLPTVSAPGGIEMPSCGRRSAARRSTRRISCQVLPGAVIGQSRRAVAGQAHDRHILGRRDVVARHELTRGPASAGRAAASRC